MEDKITEKVYCYDHPSAYNNNEAALIAAMCNKQHTDPMAMAAMMNGGMGSQWINNPFAYIMFLALLRNGFGGWGNGDGSAAQGIETQAQLNAIRTQLQDNQNSHLLMDAIKGNEFALSQLSQNLQVDFNTLQKCCCDVQSAIQQVAGQVGFSAERVINAVNMGDCNVIQALKDCCCATQKSILEMGYQNQLQNCQQTNTIMTGISGVNTGVERGFANLGNIVNQGFSQVGFQAQQDKCDIVNAINAAQQRTSDLLTTHWQSETERKLQDAKFEISQLKQNQYLAGLINGGNCGCGSCGC